MAVDEVWAAVRQVTSDPRERAAMLMGAALETSCQNVSQYGGGPGRGYWQVEAGVGGSHRGEISEADALDPVKAAQFMLADYRAAAADIGEADYLSDPAHAYAEAAYRAERPAQRYPEQRIRAAWLLVGPTITAEAPTPAPGTQISGVYGEDIVALIRQHIGESHSDHTLDPFNRAAYPYHQWGGFCLSLDDGARYTLGLPVVYRNNAAEVADAAGAQGLLMSGTPEHGALCVWGRDFDPQGHICVWDADKGQFLTTLLAPAPYGTIGYYYSDAWRGAMRGWFRAPGVVAPRRAVAQQPVVPPVAPPTPANGNVILPGQPQPAGVDDAHRLGLGGGIRDFVLAISEATRMQTVGFVVANECDAWLMAAGVPARKIVAQRFDRVWVIYDAAEANPAWRVRVPLLTEAISLVDPATLRR